MLNPPLIGITVGNRGDQDDDSPAAGRYQCAPDYAQAVVDTGGVAMMLPQHIEHVDDYVRLCDGLILTGGGDPQMEPFGVATHPKIKRMDPRRQPFELALLEAAERVDLPVLGICLGMQLMGLRAGGTFDQYLPESLGEEQAKKHQENREHTLVFEADDSILTPIPGPAQGNVVSFHTQAILDPGAMRVIARAPDGTVEAIDDPARRFYLGVQWHPERIAADRSPKLNRHLFHQLAQAARCAR